ncbi:MAG: hypothetical protein IJZ72_01445 [Oscillospiraceae bacterium]|nr:hypothetical protein [Oscillospiraceae bacterium]
MSNNNNKKVNPVIYGLAVVIAVIGALIFKPADAAPVIEEPVTSVSVTETSVTEQTEAVTEITEATQAEVTETTTAEVQPTETASETEAVTEQETVSYYFRNRSTLESHYEKHGIDMGFSSAEEYEAAASAVINSPDALYKTEKEDGDGVYYIEETNEFAVLSTDGYIRTYFLPSAGKKYFERQ